MIRTWGSWSLFQELLATLKRIAVAHTVTISNVATRWVLDFPYVGAVIVGVRMGISEHTDETLRSFGWSLNQTDRDAIEKILAKSRRLEMLTSLGDCGREYRV
jgi:aryl-alcohol dehydrogenase-like predicted oxidoreductase